MLYNAYYKRQNQFFWRILKNVKADGFIPESPNVRFFILSDDTRIEISSMNYCFKFKKDRTNAIIALNNKEEQETDE